MTVDSNYAGERQVGRRAHARLNTHLPARMTSTHGTSNVVITNISVNGAKIQTPESLANQRDVILRFLDFVQFCKVTWYDSGFAGLSFEREIEPEIVLLLRQAGVGAVEEVDQRIAAKAWTEGNANFSPSD